jgi:hypothetical protein
MINKFCVEVCSDSDFEDLVADITYDNHTIAMIIQDKGIDNMEVHFYDCYNNDLPVMVPLDEFLKTINFAKNRLIEMKKS